jgi:hypothetical protein
MHEGFGQPTDASFANYVFIAKNSLAEVVARVNKAHKKGHISDDDLRGIRQLGEPPTLRRASSSEAV